MLRRLDRPVILVNDVHAKELMEVIFREKNALARIKPVYNQTKVVSHTQTHTVESKVKRNPLVSIVTDKLMQKAPLLQELSRLHMILMFDLYSFL